MGGTLTLLVIRVIQPCFTLFNSVIKIHTFEAWYYLDIKNKDVVLPDYNITTSWNLNPIGVIGVAYPYFTLFNYISSKFYIYYSHCQFFVLIIATANFCMHCCNWQLLYLYLYLYCIRKKRNSQNLNLVLIGLIHESHFDNVHQFDILSKINEKLTILNIVKTQSFITLQNPQHFNRWTIR